jgi:hypothetical protein
MKLEERLNEIIEEKDDQIAKLESEVESLKQEMDLSKTSWQRISAFNNDIFYKQLPFPRLEMRLNKLSPDWYSIEWVYGLVYKHVTDISNDTLLFIPMGRTTSSGGRCNFENWITRGELRLPFRDGSHIYVESLVLNLPAFIVCQEKGIFNKIEHQGWGIKADLPKMKSNGK